MTPLSSPSSHSRVGTNRSTYGRKTAEAPRLELDGVGIGLLAVCGQSASPPLEPDAQINGRMILHSDTDDPDTVYAHGAFVVARGDQLDFLEQNAAITEDLLDDHGGQLVTSDRHGRFAFSIGGR